MKRFILIFSLILSGISSAFAQKTDVNSLKELASKGRVSADYSFVFNNDVFRGHIMVQQPFFYANGNGIEIYCNGICRWTVDRVGKEVYIEKAESPDEYLSYLKNISNLELQSIRTEAPGEDLSPFIFSVENLDASWVVTDLR